MGNVMGNSVLKRKAACRQALLYKVVTSDDVPPIITLAKMFRVTIATIYSDMRLLRASGDLRVPNRIPLREYRHLLFEGKDG